MSLLELPTWALEELSLLPKQIDRLEDRMSEVIRFSRLNVENSGAGPFAAGIFEKDSGRIVAFGVNQVVPTNNSCAHAEVMAITLAQRGVGNWDLGAQGLPAHELVVSGMPCAMCFGAVIWSGVRSLVIAATSEDVEKYAGFDEGPLIKTWREELERRGIKVRENVLREEAVEILKEYSKRGLLVYNPRQGSS